MDEVKVGNVTFTKEDLPALEEIIIKLKHCEHQFNKWSEVKEDWVCRLCGITRREFLGLIDTDIPIITDNKSIKNNMKTSLLKEQKSNLFLMLISVIYV